MWDGRSSRRPVPRLPRSQSEAGKCGEEEHRCSDPGCLGQEVASASPAEYLLRCSAGKGPKAAALAGLQQHDQDQEQARNHMDNDKGGF